MTYFHNAIAQNLGEHRATLRNIVRPLTPRPEVAPNYAGAQVPGGAGKAAFPQYRLELTLAGAGLCRPRTHFPV